jgi:hypothetical protein
MHCLQEVRVSIVKLGGTHCNHLKGIMTNGTYTIHAEERKHTQNFCLKY